MSGEIVGFSFPNLNYIWILQASSFPSNCTKVTSIIHIDVAGEGVGLCRRGFEVGDLHLFAVTVAVLPGHEASNDLMSLLHDK